MTYFFIQGSGFRVQGSGFRVQGSVFSGFSGFSGFNGGSAAHFVILSGEKRRMLKNGLSEIMRTESKDLSAAEI